MKNYRVLSALALLMMFSSANAQNLIGYKVGEIKTYMKEKNKDMVFKSFVNNASFRYLKYADNDESKTVLFILEPDSVCRSVRIICDKSLKEEKVKELDSSFKKNGENSWIETRNGKQYLIEIKDEEYSFNVTMTIKKK